jgi:hypothetical protein
MRSPAVLVCALAVTACAGTEGDLLRSLPDAQPPADAAPPHPRPDPTSTWQIQLTGSLDTSIDVQVYTADIDTPASVIRDLHGAGRIMICYFSGGTKEPFRNDASRFPAASLGEPLPAYPDERWIDVRDPTVRSIMAARVARAAEVGCDGVHASGLAAYATTTGFDFTRDDQLAYDRELAAAAHGLGLSIGLVDGDATFRQDLLADFDWTVAFSCLDANCAVAAPFIGARKASFLVEYGDETLAPTVCPKAKGLGLSAIIKRNSDLDAFRVGCP